MTSHYGKRMDNILIISRKVIIYGDVNDQLALDIIAGLYPTRNVVGINCLNLAMFGGMLIRIDPIKRNKNGFLLFQYIIFHIF